MPYHMIGAHDMESGILGGYVDFIRRTHPDGPDPRRLPRREVCSSDAEHLRQAMGDEPFFDRAERRSRRAAAAGATGAGLGRRRASRPRWRPTPARRSDSQLVSDLVGKFFGSYDTPGRAGSGEAFLSLDKGLSRHQPARREPRLRRADPVPRRADPVAGQPRRRTWSSSSRRGRSWPSWSRPRRPTGPIPIISFVARQRDLRELIGEPRPGRRAAELRRRARALGGPLPHDHPGRPQPAGHRREAGAQVARARRPQRAGRRLRADGEDPRSGDEHPADQRGRPGRCSARSTRSARPWCRR